MSLFIYSYSTEIDHGVSHSNYEIVISTIKEYIEKRRGTIELIENDRLIFKGTSVRRNVFCQIKTGNFKIEPKREKLLLTFKIELKRTIFYIFFFGVLLGVFLLIFFPRIWTVCIPFLWLGGANWLITIIGNSLVLDNIILLISDREKQNV